MNFKSVKKVVSKFVLAMLLSSSFSLSSVAIGPRQEQAMKDWLSMMKLDVKEGMEFLKYEPLKLSDDIQDSTVCYLVPIYRDDNVKKFIIDLYSNPNYKDYMKDFFGHKGMMTPKEAEAKYENALISMYNSGDSRVYGHEYLDGLSGSFDFLIYYGDELAGHLSIGPMRIKSPVTSTYSLKENPSDISKVSVVIHKKYSRKGIFFGLRQFSMNDSVRFFNNAYRNNSKNERYNLNMLYTSLSKNQQEIFENFLTRLCGFVYDKDVTKFFDDLDVDNNKPDASSSSKQSNTFLTKFFGLFHKSGVDNNKPDASSSSKQSNTFLTKFFGLFHKSGVDNNKPDAFNYYYKTV